MEKFSTVAAPGALLFATLIQFGAPVMRDANFNNYVQPFWAAQNHILDARFNCFVILKGTLGPNFERFVDCNYK